MKSIRSTFFLRFIQTIFLLVILPSFLLACSALSAPPRLTQTRVPVGEQPDEVSFYAAPTPTGEALPSLGSKEVNSSSLNPILTVWINETSQAHQQVLEQMTEALDADYGLHMEFVLIDNDRLPDIIEGAAEANRLPDVIIHPIEYSAGWAARGVLNISLSESIIESLGPDTFDPDSLKMAKLNE
ncbi:MAG: hypothetical protein AB8G95_15295, partial [Anaerolineae bacterium]